MSTAITLHDRKTGETGLLKWDMESGRVSGFRAEEIADYGGVPCVFSPLSIGNGDTPALRSNDGMIALLLSLGYDCPPELKLDVVADDTTPPDGVN